MNINPMDLLKNFQNIQSQVSEMQEKLKSVRVTGTSGGGMVRIEMSGQMEVTSVSIAPEAVDPSDLKMLEDLLLAAFTDATYKMKEKLREEMSSVTGGLGFPPGMMGV
jgi:DNA-binding YbaB/EbfC family protein